MNHAKHGSTGRVFGLLIMLAGVLCSGASLWADSVLVKSGTGTITLNGTISKIDGNELYYTSTDSGNESRRPLESVLQITSANEAKLNAAEKAYADGKWDEAVTNYQAALNSTRADWVKTRAILRLIDAAGKSKQFPAQVAAFIELAKRDPASARKYRPALQGVKAEQINGVVSDVDRAVSASTNKASTDLLKEFLADLYLATGDTAHAQQVLGQPAANPAASAGPVSGSPAGGAVDTGLVLARAKTAMAARQYQAVLNDINASRSAFTDPDQQAEALYDLAEAKAATAASPLDWQDAAIAYMRLVAHFPAASNVSTALMKVAAIENDHLKQKSEAGQIYQQLIADPKLKGSQVAAEAAKRLAVIRAEPG